MLLNLALWVQATGFFTYLRGSGFVYPVILSMHMVAIAFFGGMILMTDMRMLGLAFTKRPVADLVDQLRVPKRWGLLLAATCGFLLFCCKAEEYYYNVFFRVKVTLFCVVIVHALVFRSSVYAKAAEFDREGRVPGAAKLAAGLSLLLWISIACMGRGIGYIEPPFGIHAQMIKDGHYVAAPRRASSVRAQRPPEWRPVRLVARRQAESLAPLILLGHKTVDRHQLWGRMACCAGVGNPRWSVVSDSRRADIQSARSLTSCPTTCSVHDPVVLRGMVEL